MDTLFLLLTTSVLLNFLLARWALRERGARRAWQQEAIALQRAIRDRQPPSLGAVGSGLWIVAGLFLVLGLLAMLSLL